MLFTVGVAADTIPTEQSTLYKWISWFRSNSLEFHPSTQHFASFLDHWYFFAIFLCNWLLHQKIPIQHRGHVHFTFELDGQLRTVTTVAFILSEFMRQSAIIRTKLLICCCSHKWIGRVGFIYNSWGLAKCSTESWETTHTGPLKEATGWQQFPALF